MDPAVPRNLSHAECKGCDDILREQARLSNAFLLVWKGCRLQSIYITPDGSQTFEYISEVQVYHIATPGISISPVCKLVFPTQHLVLSCNCLNIDHHLLGK